MPVGNLVIFTFLSIFQTYFHLGFYTSAPLETLVFVSVGIIPMSSPLISLYYVRPYRNKLILFYYKVCSKKSQIMDSHTETVSHGDGGSNTKSAPAVSQ